MTTLVNIVLGWPVYAATRAGGLLAGVTGRWDLTRGSRPTRRPVPVVREAVARYQENRPSTGEFRRKWR